MRVCISRGVGAAVVLDVRRLWSAWSASPSPSWENCASHLVVVGRTRGARNRTRTRCAMPLQASDAAARFAAERQQRGAAAIAAHGESLAQVLDEASQLLEQEGLLLQSLLPGAGSFVDDLRAADTSPTPLVQSLSLAGERLRARAHVTR